MNQLLEYKGFRGTVEYSAEDNLLFGKVVDLPNVLIMYDGDSLENLKKDFMEAIDFHLLPGDSDMRIVRRMEPKAVAV